MKVFWLVIGGRSITFVTQFEVPEFQSIESANGVKMEVAAEFQEFLVDPEKPSNKQFVQLLNPVSKAMRLASMQLEESGFTEKVGMVKKRKRRQKRQILRKYVLLEKQSTEDRGDGIAGGNIEDRSGLT